MAENGKRKNEDYTSIDKYVKKARVEEHNVYSDVSKNLMAKLGYKEGKGLGKMEQGIVKPIVASDQKGRVGFGAPKTKLDSSNDCWDFESEKLYECEKSQFFKFKDPPQMISSDWLEVGPEKLSLEGETNFCKSEILQGVLQGKTIFDSVSNQELMRVRSECNVFEGIGKAFFMNRAAVKMANIDAKFDFIFTQPKREDGSSLVHADEVLRFADVCAGPGGFSEYVLWRSRGQCKGFGFTLKGPNDFKMADMKAGPAEMFEPHYGVGGAEGDGDIYRQDNQSAFRAFVMAQTGGRGVHFVMADGGFSVAGQENIQEILSQRLYVCQAAVALSVLVAGGHFVCKLFDTFTPFSCGLIYLMSLCFSRVCIFKPVTSRPANSERYLICRNKATDTQAALQLLQQANEEMGRLERSGKMLRQLVPMQLMQENKPFMKYIRHSNEHIGYLQCIGLRKVEAFLRNRTLVEGRKNQVMKECMAKWQLPEIKRSSFQEKETQSAAYLFTDLLKGSNLVIPTPVVMTTTTMKESLLSSKDHLVCLLSSSSTTLLLCMGRNNIYKRVSAKSWERVGNVMLDGEEVDEMNTNFPFGTLLEVDLVEERRGKRQFKFNVFHVVDLLFWACTSFLKCSFLVRREKLRVLLHACSRATEAATDVSLKSFVPLDEVDKKVFQRLVVAPLRNEGPQPRLLLALHAAADDDDCGGAIGASSSSGGGGASSSSSGGGSASSSTGECRLMRAFCLRVVRTLRPPWIRCFSKRSNQRFFYNLSNKTSSYERPPDIDCSYLETPTLHWTLCNRTYVHPDLPKPPQHLLNGDVLSKEIFLKHISTLQ